MHPLQQFILQEYWNLKGNPSLKYVAQETGIQLTRIHRLMNSHEMRISEFSIFKDLVEKKSHLPTLTINVASKSSLAELAQELEDFLDEEEKIDFASLLEREIKKQRIKKTKSNSVLLKSA